MGTNINFLNLERSEKAAWGKPNAQQKYEKIGQASVGSNGSSVFANSPSRIAIGIELQLILFYILEVLVTRWRGRSASVSHTNMRQ